MTIEFNYFTDMQHELGTIDISPAIREMLPNFQANDALKKSIVMTLEQAARKQRPNANVFVSLQTDIAANGEVYRLGVLCIPRAFRPKPDERVKWGVAIITPDEYNSLLDVPSDEVGARLVGYLGLEGAAARYWTKVY